MQINNASLKRIADDLATYIDEIDEVLMKSEKGRVSQKYALEEVGYYLALLEDLHKELKIKAYGY